jgi:hypothetical protein
VIIFFQPVHDSRDAVFNRRHVKLDRQAKPHVGEPEIGQKLLLVDREKRLDGFDFHDDFLFDDQISSESGVNAEAASFPRLMPDIIRPQDGILPNRGSHRSAKHGRMALDYTKLEQS